MPHPNLVTLTTDFGLSDGYVGQLKGRLLQSNPSVSLVDLSHLVPAQDIRAGGRVILDSYPSFPGQSVHLGVIDPGVGSQRQILLLEADSHYFVGPDNGLFSTLLRQPQTVCYQLDEERLGVDRVSATFHGRDLMAPLAAMLAAGHALQQFGHEVINTDCVRLSVDWVQPMAGGLAGEIIGIDHFGNLRTSLTAQRLAQAAAGIPAEEWQVVMGKHRIVGIAKTYAERAAGQLMALIDSQGYLEIAQNKGNGAMMTGCGQSDRVQVYFTSTCPAA